MKDEFLEIRNYIDRIKLDQHEGYFEYEHFPFINNILQNLTTKEHDDFVEEVFTWTDYQLYIIAEFLHSTNYTYKESMIPIMFSASVFLKLIMWNI